MAAAPATGTMLAPGRGLIGHEAMSEGSFHNLLVAIRDPAKTHRALLAKAVSFAREGPCRIELFQALGPAPAGNGAAGAPRAIAIESAERRLARLAAASAVPLARITSHADIGASAPGAILARAAEQHADLIVVEYRRHGAAERLLRTSTARALLRRSVAPVLLARPRGGGYRDPVILAAVDPFHASEPEDLPQRVIEHAKGLASRLGGTVHLFHAFQPLEAVMPVASVPGEPLWVPEAGERAHESEVRAVFVRLAAAAGIPEARAHLHLGGVGEGLTQLTRRLRASILVAGSVARAGVARVLIGNTAERLIDRLDCDALIVKPRDFKPRDFKPR